jgi:hypothetical protein
LSILYSGRVATLRIISGLQHKGGTTTYMEQDDDGDIVQGTKLLIGSVEKGHNIGDGQVGDSYARSHGWGIPASKYS